MGRERHGTIEWWLLPTDLIVGCPAWDRAWALPTWFASVRANVDPAKTGLVFVIPASDVLTREIIDKLSTGFSWIEVLRDRGVQSGRSERPDTRHETLAAARNQVMQVVAAVRPVHYLSWDSDMLVPPRTVEMLRAKKLPLVAVWAWLNRHVAKPMKFKEGRQVHEVVYQDPIRATGMRWDPKNPGRALHYPADQFLERAAGVWKTDVALAWQLMDERAYLRAHYAPHHDGEDVPFNWQLESQDIGRYICGDIVGVHLYDRGRNETVVGWPQVMRLARQFPLASTFVGERSSTWQALGIYPHLKLEYT